MPEAAKALESALSPRRIGEQCRATGLGIVNNAQRWGKAELAGWLTGPYRRVTQYAVGVHGPRSETGRRVNHTLPYQTPPSTEVADGQVETLLGQLREEIICLFKGATLEKIDSFSHACLNHDFVVEHVMDDGTQLYLPVDRPRMRLLERVVSLFAADALMWPGAYSTVRICDQCSALTFGNCAHAPSGWRAKSRPLPREE
jgi:hypothetical protein